MNSTRVTMMVLMDIRLSFKDTTQEKTYLENKMLARFDLGIFKSVGDNKLSPERQAIQIKAILILVSGYSVLESIGALNTATRLAISSIAICMLGTLFYGDGEFDPEQQPRP